ncbi:MAG: PQQ-binding-like beta-propeller repeat protein [Myxococcota bacterium]
MNIDKALKKAYEDMDLKDLPRQHVTALQGISERQAKLLEEAFGITTIADLARMEFAAWAQSIVALAPTDTSHLLERDDSLAQRFNNADNAGSPPTPTPQTPTPQTPTPSPAPSTTRKSAKGSVPAIWSFGTGTSAFGVFVDDEGCWVSNEKGQVFQVDHETAAVKKQFKLPTGAMCLVGDGRFLYAGCNNGKVYDLTGDAPMVAYDVDSKVLWLDIYDGNLATGSSDGTVAAFDFEQQPLFKKKSGGTYAWMIRADRTGVFAGNSEGVSQKAWGDGAEQWSRNVRGAVLFGWQEANAVYAATSANKVHRILKSNGKPGQAYLCDGGVFSCATAEGGKFVFAGDSSGYIYCFDQTGKRLWKLKSGAQAALSMQYHKERLYLVTRSGALISVDVSPAAIEKAQAGQTVSVRTVSAPRSGGRAPVQQVETTRDAGQGVVVECYYEGSRLRVRPVSTGYRHDFHVQFPRAIREDGVRFVVDELVDNGTFYRARGNIRRLES